MSTGLWGLPPQPGGWAAVGTRPSLAPVAPVAWNYEKKGPWCSEGLLVSGCELVLRAAGHRQFWFLGDQPSAQVASRSL